MIFPLSSAMKFFYFHFKKLIPSFGADFKEHGEIINKWDESAFC
jgi:hypothetical protein